MSDNLRSFMHSAWGKEKKVYLILVKIRYLVLSDTHKLLYEVLDGKIPLRRCEIAIKTRYLRGKIYSLFLKYSDSNDAKDEIISLLKRRKFFELRSKKGYEKKSQEIQLYKKP